MILYSLEYFLLLPLVLIIYRYCHVAAKRHFLLLVSLLLISYYNLSSLFFIIFFSSLNYLAGRKVEIERNKNIKNVVFYGVIALNVIGVLFINKVFHGYLSQVLEKQNFILKAGADSTLLALGLSFYGLQNIAYLTDIFKKRIKAAQSYLDFSLYNSFFPKVSLGPIMKYQEFEKQLSAINNESREYRENIIEGVNRILLGLFKKLVLADRLAAVTSSIYQMDSNLSGANTWMMVGLFFLQLYFDFSGYMDLALGSAKLFGFRLKENFNLPLRSVSIADFWRRWHISLMDWLTTYIFFPVNFYLRRYKRFAAIVAILITFFVSGLWHGWGLTFIIYAMVHAMYMIAELFLKGNTIKAAASQGFNGYILLKQIGVFVLVSFSLIFFRSPDLDIAINIIQKLFQPNGFFDTSVSWRTWLINGGGNIEVTFNNRLSIILSILFILYERKLLTKAYSNMPDFFYLFFIILLILLFGVFGNVQRFIYLQF